MTGSFLILVSLELFIVVVVKDEKLNLGNLIIVKMFCIKKNIIIPTKDNT